MKTLSTAVITLLSVSTLANAADKLPEGTATSFTRKANDAVYQELNFNDKESFDDATKGLIATLPDGVIKATPYNYDTKAFEFTHGKKAPDTTNPSLWRQSQLTSLNGLFKVADKIYQIRGFDLANMTLIEGKNGWIIIDPLTSVETAAAGLKLANEKLGARKVSAVIYTHSHVDHFGGVMGVLTPQEVKDKKIPIIAPEGFMEEAVSENLYAGNAMNRRATYMYGVGLDNNPKGNLGTGLGSGLSVGTRSIAEPNKLITKTGEKMTIDGVDIVFQMAPGTEAPSEMIFYFPQMKALCLSEDATSTMHNLYTLRGAKVRSPLVWSNALTTTLQMFGKDAEVSFASHHWPRWTNAKITQHIKDQRDMYKFINDQTLRLANMGYDAEEIAEKIKLPDSLGKKFYNRGYYGSLNHDVKATYQLYLGFYNGNPATLHEHPRVEVAQRYVKAMGGSAKVLKIGREAFNSGDYRWAAEVVNHLVYAEPKNKDARMLQAAALEQMGFQAESGPWRDVYLMGAKELRENKATYAPPLVDPTSLPLAMLMDYTALRMNPDKSKNKKMNFGVMNTDTKERMNVVVENSVLVAVPAGEKEKFDTMIEGNSAQLGKLFGGTAKAGEMQNSDSLKISGDRGAISDLVATLDNFDGAFNLVTPVEPRQVTPLGKPMADLNKSPKEASNDESITK
ncbi:alkyl/aryl-sulfatase [Bdellovibrio sp. NC01]|uniref:alkyl/aryl-sulfatase n=1 Tax=Bdellovibrio sp. NC01 TaxID=2220073 RepID=UPI0011581830|nr:alkyl sulfatase dimerization domain-containing protein [Bdellovibrio sp. NC01]QDK39194.1 alkyl/aryl-sulfatase [Bdellovibrio sp. NC01]